MYFFMMLFAFIGFGIPTLNSYNYAFLNGKNKYIAFGTMVSLSSLAVGYYVYYSIQYLDELAGSTGRVFAYIACIWISAMLIIALPLLVLRFLSLFGGKKIWQVLSSLVLIAGFALATYGCIDGNLRWERERIDLEYRHLPPAFDGMKIALLADTHIGPYYTTEDLRTQLEDARLERADYVIIAGDLIDEVKLLPVLQELLNEEAGHFRHGIDFVWGTHEFYRGKQEIEAVLKETPIRILANEHYKMNRGGDEIYIAGVDFSFRRDDGDEEKKLFARQAFEGIPSAAFTILIAHHPDFIDIGQEFGADLVVAGHTHGGQVGIGGQTIFPLYKYNMGLFQLDTTVGYVSRGTGHWMPFRFGCPREITYITLKRKK